MLLASLQYFHFEVIEAEFLESESLVRHPQPHMAEAQGRALQRLAGEQGLCYPLAQSPVVMAVWALRAGAGWGRCAESLRSIAGECHRTWQAWALTAFRRALSASAPWFGLSSCHASLQRPRSHECRQHPCQRHKAKPACHGRVNCQEALAGILGRCIALRLIRCFVSNPGFCHFIAKVGQVLLRQTSPGC